MTAKKESKNSSLVVGNVVKVIESKKKGKVVNVSYAGDDKSTPVYAVKLSETETRHYSGDELEFVSAGNPEKEEEEEEVEE